jgi:hypothetical protein
MKRIALAATCFVSLALAAIPASAGPITIYVEGSSKALATLDPTTGVITAIGPTSVLLDGLGFVGGSLYGLGSDANLYEVNTSTAALTLIGPYTGNFNSGATMGSSSDGTLYSLNGVGDDWTVNPTSGAATPLGNMGTCTTGCSDPSGDGGSGLYITSGSDLILINRTTGAGTLIGAGSYGEAFGLAYTNNTMYAMQALGTGIYSLNLANGQSTLVGNYGLGVGTIEAAAAFNSAAVPEPSSIILLGLGGLGLFGRRWTRSRVQDSRAA